MLYVHGIHREATKLKEEFGLCKMTDRFAMMSTHTWRAHWQVALVESELYMHQHTDVRLHTHPHIHHLPKLNKRLVHHSKLQSVTIKFLMWGFISLESVLYISLSYALVDFGETGHLID